MTSPTIDAVAAADALSRSELFATLPEAAREELAHHLERLEVPAGELVVREGEAGDRYFLIASGEAEVWVRRGSAVAPASADQPWVPDPQRHTLQARLGPGEGFGELAVLLGGARRATVRATSNLVLLALDGERLRQTLDRHRGLAVALEEELTLREVANFLGKSSPFAGLPPEAMHWLALRLEPVRFEADEELMCEGDPGEALFIVRSGTAAVLSRRADGGERTIATAGPGDALGEQALITGEPRAATVRALEPVEALRLSRTDFEAVLREHRERGSYFYQLTLQRQRPHRIARWTMERQESRGGDVVYILKDEERHRYLKLSEQGAFLWDLMDGEHTVRELTLAYFARYHVFGLDAVMGAMLQLNAAGFLHIQRLDAQRLGQVANLNRLQRAGLKLLPWVSHYFALPDLDGFATALYRYLYRPFYLRPVLWLLALLAAGGAAQFVRFAVWGGAGAHGSASGLALAFFAGFLLQGLLHEAGHAMTCKHYGRAVHRAGVGWYFFMPVAFVDTSDIWLSGRGPRAAVAFAGPYVNFILSGVATLLIPLAPAGAPRIVLLQFALTGYALGLFNLNPLIEFDGYYVLMDWLDVPNLRRKAFAFLGGVLWRAGRTTGDARLVRIFSVYGAMSLLYTVLVAATVLLGYHGYVQGVVGRVLPAPLAASLGWLAALTMGWLLLMRAWNDLRAGAKRRGRRASGA